MNRATTAAIVAAFILAACGGAKIEDLRAWVKEQDKMPRPRIQPPPDVQPYEPFIYKADADGLDNPFKERKTEQPITENKQLKVQQDRPKEALEGYPLENLKMVGTLAQDKQFYAVIKAPDNNLFRVKSGNYLGQNFGRITEITDAAVQLKELVQDSGGEWVERVTTMQLQEQ